jgi:hypothetical protein
MTRHGHRQHQLGGGADGTGQRQEARQHRHGEERDTDPQSSGEGAARQPLDRDLGEAPGCQRFAGRRRGRGGPAALGIGMRQNVIAADLVVKGVEAITGFSLRFGMQRRLRLLNTLRS